LVFDRFHLDRDCFSKILCIFDPTQKAAKVMKKIILLLAALPIATIVFAQGGPYMGVKGTAGLSPIYNETWWNHAQIEYQPALSWGVGPSIGYNAIYYNIGYTIGGFYKTYTQKFRINRGENFGENEHAFLQMNYLDVPIMLRFRPKGDQVTRKITYGGPYFEIGVQPSMLLNIKHKHTDTTGRQIMKDISKGDFEKYNVAAVVGFGFHQIGTAKWSLTHGFRLSFAFLDVVKGDKDILGVSRLNEDKYQWKHTRLLNVSYILTLYHKWPKKRE
jgi:hypothetical protein